MAEELEKDVEKTEDPTPKAAEKTFTQAELDDHIAKRLARATKDMPSKEDLTAYKKWQDEQKTEQQKLVDAQVGIAATLQKANDRFILAEIKALDGYDTKLVSRLIDKSKLKVGDDGEVVGLKEALAELEKEFPQIKIAAQATPGANPANTGGTALSELQSQYAEALKTGNGALAVALKNKIFAMTKK